MWGRRDLAGSKQTPGMSVLGLAGPSRSCGIEAELRGGVVEKVLTFKPGISGIPTQELVGGDVDPRDRTPLSRASCLVCSF